MEADTDDADLGSELDWQKITTRKRHVLGSPKLYANKRKTMTTNNENEPSTSNKFAMLQNNDDDDESNDNDDDYTAVTTPKPPPIYIPDVFDFNKMI